jgi:flagellin-like hook-associated protein FlgL
VDFWADLGIDVESAEGLKDAKKLFGKFEMGMQSGTWEDIVLVYNDGDGGVISQTVKALEVAEYADKTGSFSTITVNELLGAMSDKVDGLIFEYNGDTNEVEIFASDKDIVISSISGSFTPAGLSFSAIACGAIKELDLAKQLAQLEGDYNSILDQIDMLANDSSYQGINLLNDDSPANKLTVFFNEDLSEDSVLKVQGVDVTALGLGLTEANWTETTEAGIETSINQSQSARGALRDASSGFSTSSAILDTRSDFTDEMVSTLKAGAGELVNADMNEESANMLALQTRQQLGTISLSIANQSEQSILRLF